MATITIEPGSDGSLWVTLTRFGEQDLARLKRIPGHRWNSERKQWQFPDTAETRAALAEFVANPSSPSPRSLAVKPKQGDAPANKPRHRYVAGRDKPLTTNPPHPLAMSCATRGAPACPSIGLSHLPTASSRLS